MVSELSTKALSIGNHDLVNSRRIASLVILEGVKMEEVEISRIRAGMRNMRITGRLKEISEVKGSEMHG